MKNWLHSFPSWLFSSSTATLRCYHTTNSTIRKNPLREIFIEFTRETSYPVVSLDPQPTKPSKALGHRSPIMIKASSASFMEDVCMYVADRLCVESVLKKGSQHPMFVHHITHLQNKWLALQNLLYFNKKKTHVVFFCFSFQATFIFELWMPWCIFFIHKWKS